LLYVFPRRDNADGHKAKLFTSYQKNFQISYPSPCRLYSLTRHSTPPVLPQTRKFLSEDRGPRTGDPTTTSGSSSPSSCPRASSSSRYNSRSSAISIRVLHAGTSTYQQDTIRNSNSCSSSCWRTSSSSRYTSRSSNSYLTLADQLQLVAFPPIPIRVLHAGAPASTNEILFAIPILVLHHAGASVPARDTLRVTLQF